MTDSLVDPSVCAVHFPCAAVLGWLELHTGVRKVYIASFLLLLLLLLVFRGTGMGCVSVLVGFLYPLHMSLKTIENCTSLFEQITGDNRNKHTEEQIREKRGEIIGQLRQWSTRAEGTATQRCNATA